MESRLETQLAQLKKVDRRTIREHKKVGLDIAIQAARAYLARTDASPTELMRYAQICKIESRFRPYLQVLLS